MLTDRMTLEHDKVKTTAQADAPLSSSPPSAAAAAAAARGAADSH